MLIFSLGMPTPVSDTVTYTLAASSLTPAVMEMTPCRVNLAALPTRLYRICGERVERERVNKEESGEEDGVGKPLKVKFDPFRLLCKIQL